MEINILPIESSGEIVLWVASIGAIAAGFMVISSTNPVHAIFSLVLAFGFATILLIAEGAEFLGILFTIVYVGAIAILFLFVVMMLNIRLVELLDNATRYVPIGFIIGATLLGELVLMYDREQFRVGPVKSIWLGGEIYTTVSGERYHLNEISEPGYTFLHQTNNIHSLGEFLYNIGWDLFMVAGVILLIAMIGAIVLTLHHGKDIQRQDIYGQIIAKVGDMSSNYFYKKR